MNTPIKLFIITIILSVPQLLSAQTATITGSWKSETQQGLYLQLNNDGSGGLGKEKIKWSENNNQFTVQTEDKKNYIGYVNGPRLILTEKETQATLSFTKALSEQSARTSANVEPAQKIIGLWKGTTGSMEFKKDGTLTNEGITYTYRISEKRITLFTANNSLEYSYTISGDTLTTSFNGVTNTFYKMTEEK